MRALIPLVTAGLLWLLSATAMAATTVPNEIKMPGTQPGEVLNPDSSQCGQCHGGFNSNFEPYHQWRGSMMSHAGEDPLWWGQLAIAEQDFDGSGDLCIRCHMPGAWLSGRSTPTDASAITTADAWYGIECAVCHRMTNPDQTEWLGEQNAPFIAKTGDEGHYGAGQYVMWYDHTRFGPYADAAPPHPARQSQFHRSSDMCGTCHDVSNPMTGDLAPNNGAQQPLTHGFSGVLGSALEGKAAFNHPPYKYGIVERTYSEHVASSFPTFRVRDYNSLPADLQDGAIQYAYEMATANGNGDYSDGTTRYFTCQSCHLPPVRGYAAWMGAPTRNDLPKHDLTGGNYWTPQAIMYMDDQGTLARDTLISGDRAAMEDGIERALANLARSASLTVQGNTLKVTNLTGHKLISGYPEGRRMWLNMKWYDANGNLLREDGAYGDLQVQIDGQWTTVQTLEDLHDPNAKVYEVHGAITQEWAAKLVNEIGSNPNDPIQFDRVTGAVTMTLGELANAAPGSYAETFHFVLNNKVAKDNRIPPYGMRFDEAKERNALPVPASQYGNPGPGGVYEYWDEVSLNPPAGAAYGDISLLFQPVSWEYIQFLFLANNGSNASLATVGVDLLDAWLNTGMAEPAVMATTTWGQAPEPEMAIVPNVVGMDQTAAEAAIEAAGLVVGSVSTQRSSSVPRDDVISQNPSAGTEVEPGSAVNLVVSRGSSWWWW